MVYVLIASLADALLARHAIFPPQQGAEGRLRDEPKERLREANVLRGKHNSKKLIIQFYTLTIVIQP